MTPNPHAMKAEDLMIGNYLQSPRGVEAVGGISENGTHLHFSPMKESPWISYLIDLCKPIPLTGDWLVKLPENIDYPNWIQFVHELQNWYFWHNNKKELVFKI